MTIAQAQKEVAAAAKQALALTPDEQLAFWQALNGPVELTSRQKTIARLMQGES